MTQTLPTQSGEADEHSSERDLLDLLAVVTSLCAGDCSVRVEPREGLAGQVVARVNELATLQERRNPSPTRSATSPGRHRGGPR